MNIYVANLSREITEDDLRRAFEAFGQVRSVNIVKDGVTGESRGFGFVGMPIRNEAQTAIGEMNGKDLKGHTIKVEEGRRKTVRWDGGGRRGGLRDGRGGRNRQGSSGRGGRPGRRY
ncbi:MAG: RNA recognition motif domain-containing protein [Sedimentisphaerales bacterium]